MLTPHGRRPSAYGGGAAPSPVIATPETIDLNLKVFFFKASDQMQDIQQHPKLLNEVLATTAKSIEYVVLITAQNLTDELVRFLEGKSIGILLLCTLLYIHPFI